MAVLLGASLAAALQVQTPPTQVGYLGKVADQQHGSFTRCLPFTFNQNPR
jgi:hypothetical protein